MNLPLLAQSNCAIYQKVADTIYKRVNVSLYSPNQKYPINPVDPQIDTTSLKMKNETSHFLYIKGSIIPLQQSDVRNWIAADIGIDSIKRTVFVNSKRQSIKSCTFGYGCCYGFGDSEDEISKELVFCEQNKRKLAPQSLAFSDILYSKNNKLALLVADFKGDFSAISSIRWLILMEKKNKVWVIKKIKGHAK